MQFMSFLSWWHWCLRTCGTFWTFQLVHQKKVTKVLTVACVLADEVHIPHLLHGSCMLCWGCICGPLQLDKFWALFFLIALSWGGINAFTFLFVFGTMCVLIIYYNRACRAIPLWEATKCDFFFSLVTSRVLSKVKMSTGALDNTLGRVWNGLAGQHQLSYQY